MMKKKTIEDQIQEAVDFWGIDEMIKFLKDVIRIYELYDVEVDDDWVQREVGDEFQTVRLIRTVYLLSVLAENHAGKLCSFSLKFPKLFKKMENEIK